MSPPPDQGGLRLVPPGAAPAGRTDLARERSIGRAACALGLAGVLGNVLGVAFLYDVPSPYRPGDVTAWLAGSHAHALETVLSSWAFTLGLLSLAAFAVLLALAVRPARPGLFYAGAALLAGGALLNAAGTMAPAAAVAVLAAPPDPAGLAAGRALLALTLHLDAHFNLALGIALVLLVLGVGPDRSFPAWLRGLGLAAGVASLPVALQFHDDAFAKLLAISGPLWILWFAIVSVRLARR